MQRHPRPLRAVAVTGLLLLALLAAALGTGLATSPVQAAAPSATSSAGTSGGSSYAAPTDWTCRPTAQRPTPVVIVHGTFGDSRSLLERLTWTLKARGYCVYSIDYGNRATGPIEDSAAQLAAYVDRVLAATGAARVSMVGHSQGGMMPRYYLKYLGGAGKVDDLVGLAPSNHGTSNPLLLLPVEVFCYSCRQQQTGSAFLTDLNAGDETPGPVSYTNVVTQYDQVVIPYTSGYLAGDRTTNVRIQGLCATDLSDHLFLPSSGPALRVVLNALERPGPADPSFRPSCLP